MKNLKQLFDEYKQARILDVGTGRGNFIYLVKHLTDDFSEVIGIDTSEKVVEFGKAFDDERIKLIQMDAFNTEFDDQSFDVICLSNSLHHFVDHKNMFKEMERLVKKGGSILILDLVRDVFDEQQKAHLMLHDLAGVIDRQKGVPHNPSYTSNEMVDIIKEHCSLSINKEFFIDHEEEFPPLTDEQKQNMFKTIDAVVGGAIEDQEKCLEQGEVIKKFIEEIGYLPQSQYGVILK